MKTKPSECENVTVNKNGCQKAKEKRWTRQNMGLYQIKKFVPKMIWGNENTIIVPSCSTVNSTMDENQPDQFVIEEERLETAKSTDEEAMEIDETTENQPRKHMSFLKVEKQKRNRNPLTYVNKSYKGVNNMDLEQRSFDETLRLFDGSTRKVTRSVVKVLDEFENSEEPNFSRQEVPEMRKKRVQKMDCGEIETNENENRQKLVFERGQIVWGYFRGWWPALIIEADDVGMVPSKNESQFVFWIGSKQISEIPIEKIELFSERRRLHMLENVFNQPELSAKKYKPCRKAVELLNQKLQDPEMKLTGKWVEAKLFPSKDQVDGIRFFPYPSHIQNTLEELKKSHEIANAKKTQYIKKELKEKKEQKVKKEKIVKKEKKVKEEIPFVNLVSFGTDQLELKDQKIGTIAWTKEPDQQIWPVMIVDYRDGDMKEPKFKNQWVVRYGDFGVTQVDIESLIKFRNGFNLVTEIEQQQLTVKDYLNGSQKKMENLNKVTKKEKTFENAVLQATKDYCEQRGMNSKNWKLNDVLAWLDSNPNLERCEVVPSYSNVIREKLYLKKTRTFECPRKTIIEESDMLRNVLKKVNDINEMCLICMKTSTNYKSHPFFKGQICEHCLDGFLPTLYKFGTDGKFVFCSLCGGVGTMVVCSASNCPFVFCVGCLKCLIIPKDFDRVMMQDPWNCFFCNKSQTYRKFVVEPRDNWRLRRDKMLNNFPRELCPVLNADGSKKRARVLSLFDGISTGFLALKGLKIDVEVYYASEIDPDAIKVSHMNFPTEIIRIGDVRMIDEKMLSEMAPIDILLGGSPCNDLSMANPKRKGLNDPTGTGILFYEYVRIKELVEKVNQGHELFWLYENVASMSAESRERINECLGRKPDVIDSAQYSAQHRPRLYWNNFPDGISSYSSPDLQEMLDPHCGRTALVKKMRTITANRNSLRKGRKFDLKPIMMNGVPDVLRTSELERIFGFPPHYTDANINLCTRHKLIGKSWSVPTIRALMYPLCEYFKSSDE